MSIECPACGGRDVAAVEQWPAGDRRVMACWGCGLLFLHPQPADDMLQAYYAPDGGWQAKRPDPPPAKVQTKTKKGAPALFEALDRYLPASAPPPGARVLDFGCGTGTWLNSFQDRGWETFGIEPSSDAAFVRHRRLVDIPTEPLFDLVVVYHVLEHLPRPLDTVHRLARALRPGGFCYLSVPRLDTLNIHGDRAYCLNPRNHIVAFTDACLRGLLGRAGLGVVAALHDLDRVFTKGEPVRLRLLAQQGAPAGPLPDPAVALRAVLDSVTHSGVR